MGGDTKIDLAFCYTRAIRLRLTKLPTFVQPNICDFALYTNYTQPCSDLSRFKASIHLDFGGIFQI